VIFTDFTDFSESRMLRERCPGGRSRGCTCRCHCDRAAEVPSDTLAPADVLEHAEPRACLAPDYLIHEIVWWKCPGSSFLPRRRGKEVDMSHEPGNSNGCARDSESGVLWDRWRVRCDYSLLRIIRAGLEFARPLRF